MQELVRAKILYQKASSCIVNIGTVKPKAMIGSDSYSVAKAGIHALTRTVAVRYGPDGIRCATVAPGTIATDAWQERVDRNPQIFEKLKPWYPLGRGVIDARRCATYEPDYLRGLLAKVFIK